MELQFEFIFVSGIAVLVVAAIVTAGRRFRKNRSKRRPELATDGTNAEPQSRVIPEQADSVDPEVTQPHSADSDPDEPEEPAEEVPAAPEPDEPEEPAEEEPAAPAPDEPEEPSEEEPAAPAPDEPEEPAEEEPAAPAPEEPEEPAEEEPAAPAPEEPEEPAEEEPAAPEPEAPEEPAEEEPADPEEPAEEVPEAPDPEEPGAEEPAAPEPEEPGHAQTTNRVTPYVPSIRTPATTKREPQQKRNKSAQTRRQQISLSVSVRAVFGRRNSVQISLLPARSEGLDEEIQVDGPDGDETWFGQDEWYGDFSPADIGKYLSSGMRWASNGVTWVLSPRDVYVLAPNSTISAFVTATRLLLNENQLVLCRDGRQELVRNELEMAGCAGFEQSSARGIPEGWVLFVDVCPTNAVVHEESVGILNILRPIQDVDILFEGGIRLTHKKWLHGHPPRIRIRGVSDQDQEVSIDDQPARLDADGSYKTLMAFELGQHVVFCGGAAAGFEIVDGQESWELFVAHAYTIDRDSHSELSVCGPTVMGHGEQSLVPTTNRCLIGAQPGQISICRPLYGQAASDYVTIM